jgi:hypothetical protein
MLRFNYASIAQLVFELLSRSQLTHLIKRALILCRLVLYATLSLFLYLLSSDLPSCRYVDRSISYSTHKYHFVIMLLLASFVTSHLKCKHLWSPFFGHLSMSFSTYLCIYACICIYSCFLLPVLPHMALLPLGSLVFISQSRLFAVLFTASLSISQLPFMHAYILWFSMHPYALFVHLC